MSDVIKFRCKGCEKKISVRAEYAGKKVKCPGCKEPLRVPSPRPKRSATGVPVAVGGGDAGEVSGGLDSNISLAELAAMEENAQAEIKELSSKPGRQSPAMRIEGGKDCPDCGASSKQDSVICVHCGHSFESGKRLKTKKDSKLGKALATVKGTDQDGSGYNDGTGWSLWALILGSILSVAGIAMALFDFRPETDPDSDTAHILEVALLFIYDTMGGIAAGGIALLVGVGLLAYGFKVHRRLF